MPAEPLLPPRFAAWQDRLARAFFEDVADNPVIFFVDDDELARILDSDHCPAEDLASAVREVADPARGHHIFDRATGLVGTWARGSREKPPPVLPILAISSLAAARMHSDAVARRHNYYLRLAQALLPEADDATVDATRLILRDSAFLAVAEMWQQLDRWLADRGGAAGISTIRDHPTLTRVGFPRSQAMITRSDRAALTAFFAALNITDLGTPPAEALIEYLGLWASRRHGFSDTFNRVLADNELRPLLESIVSGLARNWDGRVITPEGLTRCDSAVVVDLEAWRTGWVVAADGLNGPDVARGRIGGIDAEVAIEPDPYSAFARSRGLPSSAEPGVIRQGFRLRGTHSAIDFAGTDLLVCREHPDTAGWVSGGTIEPYVDHVIAAYGDLARDVRRVLEVAADPGWRTVTQQATQPLLSGFAIFYRVSFSDPASLDDALANASSLVRRRIRPGSTTRARLVNGLPLAARVGPHHYLAGGEPDILLPVAEEARAVPASLDGTPQTPAFTATGFPIPLRRIGPLSLGEHTVETDLDVLRFVMLGEEPAPGPAPGTGDIGWDYTGEMQHDSTALIRGAASLPIADDEEPLLIRRGASRTWLIKRSGECASVEEAAPLSGSLSAISGVGGYYFELLPDRSSAWFAEERRGRITLRPLRRLGPQFVRLDADSLAAWALIAPHGPADDELWQLYLAAWERCRGR